MPFNAGFLKIGMCQGDLHLGMSPLSDQPYSVPHLEQDLGNNSR